MKKILMLFIIILTFVSCSSLQTQEKAKQDICQELENATGDKFWFIYGLDKEKSFGTEVRYRGILYSDRLEKMHWPEGLEIGLTSLKEPNLRTILINYKGLLSGTKITKICEDKAREIFGEKTNFSNDGGATEYMYNNIMNNRGKNLIDDNKSVFMTSGLNIFVDDLDKINITEYRKKIYEFGMFLYEYMNIKTALNVIVRDDKYFEDITLTYYSIYRPFRDRKDINVILNKIAKKEKLDNKDKTTLVYSFNKGSLDYKKCHYKFFMFASKYPENLPLSLKIVEYRSESMGGKDIYNLWAEEKKPKEQQKIIE